MAKDKGYIAKIGADVSGFQTAMADIKKSTQGLKSELTIINKELKLDPTNTVLQAQKMEILKKQAEAAEKELNELSRAKQKMEEIGSDGTEEGAAALREYQREVEKCKKAVAEYTKYQNELAKTTSDVSASTGTISKSAEETAKATEKAEKGTANWAAVLKGNLLSSAVITGLQTLLKLVTEIGEKTLNVGMNFESEMAQIAATKGISKTSEDFNNLSVAAQHMGATTKFSAAESASALNMLALAGYSVQESIADLPVVLGLAQAGGLDLSQSADLLTNAMNALGLATADMSAEMKADVMARFSDELAVTAQNATTDVSALGEAILKIGASAQGLKGGTAELNTMLGALADVSLTGSEGGTHLRNIINTLKSGADDFKAIGVDVYDLNGELNALPDIVEQLKQSFDGLTDAERDAQILDLFKETDLAAINGLLNTTTERYAELREAIDNSAGAAQTMASTMNDTLEGAITSCNSAIEGFLINIYNAVQDDLKNAVIDVAAIIGELGQGFNDNLNEGKVQELTDRVSDYLISFSSNLIEKIGKLSESIIPTMLESINDNLKDVSHSAYDVVYVFASSIISNLPLIFDGALRIIEGLATGLGDSLPDLIPVVIRIIGEIVDTLGEHINDILTAAEKIVGGLIEGLLSEKSMQALTYALSSIINGVVKAVEGLIVNFFSLGVNIIDEMKKGMEDFNIVTYCNNLGYAMHEALENGFNKYQKKIENSYVSELRQHTKAELEQMQVDLSDEQQKMREAWKEFDNAKKADGSYYSPYEFEDWLNSYTIKNKNQVLLNSMYQKAKQQNMNIAEYFRYYYGESNGEMNETDKKRNLITDVLQSGTYKEVEEKPIEEDTTPKTTSISKAEAERQAHELEAKKIRDINKANAGKTASDVIFNEDRLKEKMHELDHQYKIHALSEDEYFKARQKVLNTYTDKTNELWWKYQDEVQAYYDKQADAVKSSEAKAKTEAENRAKEEAKAQEKAWSDRLKDLQDTVKRGKSEKDTSIVSSAVATMEALLNEIDKDSDVYKECVKAINEGKEDVINIEASVSKELAEKRLSDIEFNKKVTERADGELQAAKEYLDSVKRFIDDVAGSEYYEDNAQKLQEKLWAAEDSYNQAFVTAYKADISQQIETLESIRDTFEDSVIGDQWYADELEKIIGSIDNSDVASAFADKLTKAKSQVEKNAEEAEKAVKAATEKYKNSISFFRDGQSLEGEDAVIINDLEKQRKQVQQITAGIEKLKERGFSDDYIQNAVVPLSANDGTKQKAITALLGLTDEQIKQELADYEGLKADMLKLAEVENNKQTDEIVEGAVNTVDSALGEAIENAYKTGIDTATAFKQGLTDGLNESTLNAQAALQAQGIVTTKTAKPSVLPYSSTSSTSSTTTTNSGTNIDNLTVAVSVAGTEVIKKTVRDILRENKITQGNNTGL